MVNEWQGFADSLTQAFGEDFVEDFIKTIQDEKRAEEEVAFSSQRRIAAATERLEHAWLEGFGEHHMSLDPTVFWHWQRKEPGCWGDKNFVREFKRDNPEVRVKSRARKVTVLRP